MTDQSDEQNREFAQRAHGAADDNFKTLNEAATNGAHAALRAAMVVNGGAAVAILAFAGSLASDNEVDLRDVGLIANSLARFGDGLIAAVVGMMFAYFTNYLYAASISARPRIFMPPYLRKTTKSQRLLWGGMVCHAAGVIAFLASVGLFVCGLSEARGALETLRFNPPSAAQCG